MLWRTAALACAILAATTSSPPPPPTAASDLIVGSLTTTFFRLQHPDLEHNVRRLLSLPLLDRLYLNVPRAYTLRARLPQGPVDLAAYSQYTLPDLDAAVTVSVQGDQGVAVPVILPAGRHASGDAAGAPLHVRLPDAVAPPPGQVVALPSWVAALRRELDAAGLGGRLRVLRPRDLGPATKLLPTMGEADLPRGAMIITFDDDRAYDGDVVRAVVAAGRQRPGHAITVGGGHVGSLSGGGGGEEGEGAGDEEARRLVSGIRAGDERGVEYERAGLMDLVMGATMVLYRKRFFEDGGGVSNAGKLGGGGGGDGDGGGSENENENGNRNETGYRSRNEDMDGDSQHGRGSVWDYEGHPAFAEHCLFVDDVWFSGHLAKNGVGVWTIGATGRDAEYTAVDGVAPLHRTGSRDAHNVGCARAMRDVFGVWGGSRDGGGRPS